MKRITIGRNPSCDVVIDNRMVSRNHALLNIYPTGKLEIISMGTNGTKVKGHLISNGQRYPLRRGDDVTFAGTANLDWSLVPDPLKIWKITAAAIGGVLVVALVVWALVALNGRKTTTTVEVEEEEYEQFAIPTTPRVNENKDDQSTGAVVPGQTSPEEDKDKDKNKEEDQNTTPPPVKPPVSVDPPRKDPPVNHDDMR